MSLQLPPNPNDTVLTPEEFVTASERGRLMAAEAIKCNPESRKRVESQFGIPHCRRRYPEAYRFLDEMDRQKTRQRR